MKKFLLLLIFSFFVLPTAFAQPSIESIRLEPENSFCIQNLCDDVLISVNCTGSDTKVFGYLSAPIQTGNFSFTNKNNIFEYMLPGELFKAVQSSGYTLNIVCEDSSGQDSSIKDFFVSKLEASIDSITSPSYLGDESASLKVSVKKDGSSVPLPWVSFALRPLSLKSWYFLDPFYNILLDIPKTVGTYSLELDVNVSIPGYKSKIIKLTTTLEVKEPLDFKVAVDKTEVRPGEILTLSLSALERGNNIILTKDFLNFQVDSTPISSSIYSVGNYFEAKLQMPDLPAGWHDLKVALTYKNYSITQTRAIGYTLPISGKIGTSTEIKFLVDGIEKKKIVTDSSGSYSGYVVPGSYDVQLTFPQSVLYLHGVTINEFNDPIKYYFFDADVEGIKGAGLFVYEVALTYSNAKIVMSYVASKVTDEKSLLVYKCSDFNPANKVCSTKWLEQPATIDTVRKLATVETSSLSAYIVGTRKSLYLDFSSDKSIFELNELIRIRGVVRDESGNFVPNALVNCSVDVANIKASAYSDSSGVFVLEFFAPFEEGVYTLLVSAEKGPYLSSNKTWSFQVTKSRVVSLVVPSTIRMKKGENQTLQFSVINTGQTDLLGLNLSLTGLPQEYFSIPERIDEIKVGQEVKIPVAFKIPSNASEATLSLTFSVSSNEVSKSETIGFTILSENATQPSQAPGFSFPTATLVLPALSADIIFVIAFGVFCVSLAYFLKKRKKREAKERTNIKNLLSDIKAEIRRKKHPMQAFNQMVEKFSEKG